MKVLGGVEARRWALAAIEVEDLYFDELRGEMEHERGVHLVAVHRLRLAFEKIVEVHAEDVHHADALAWPHARTRR